MTKEITKARIIQEIQDKFALRELEPEVFSFSERVIPTYNVEQHLLAWTSKYETVQMTSAAAFEFFEVPENEKWKLRRYDVVFLAAGAYKVTGLYVTRKGSTHVYLDLKKAQTESYHIDLVEPVDLQPGDKIHVLIDDYTSTAGLRVYIDYQIEVVR